MPEHRWSKGMVQLLVCREGFPDRMPTWESMNSILEDAPTTVNTYVKSIVPEEERRRVASEVTRLKKGLRRGNPSLFVKGGSVECVTIYPRYHSGDIIWVSVCFAVCLDFEYRIQRRLVLFELLLF